MAFFKGEVHSSALDMDTGINVIMPQDFERASVAAKDPARKVTGRCKVLYLLHGLTDGCGAWSRFTSIERYARERGIAVVMPEVQHSFYTDMKYGMKYFTYVAQELPSLMASMFQISTAREDSYIAGLSMGGYGALKCALTYPERYCAVAGFSSALDIRCRLSEGIWDDPQFSVELKGIFGDSAAQTDDLFYLAQRAAQQPQELRPRVYTACGTRDMLHGENLAFKEHMESLPFDYLYEEWDGDHEWSFWDTAVQRALSFFFDEARQA